MASAGVDRVLEPYLARHEITFRFAKAKIDLHDIGLALQYCAKTNGAELLVMGAFRQGRLQQFVLGGATRHVLNHLQLPVFMSNS
ncbi:MAG TPA: universal stress protein [Devosia sp.]|nr:universal stress protein [Devosia sp.]